MSDLQPGLLEGNKEGVKTLQEAFGFSLFDLHIANEEGREISDRVRDKIILDIMGEDAEKSGGAKLVHETFKKVANLMPGDRLRDFFFRRK